MTDPKSDDVEKTTEQSGNPPAATEVERDLALQAAKEFEARHYDQCLSILSQLTSSRGQDSKVIHNRAIVEYYKSDMAKTDEFKKALQEINHKSQFSLENLSSVEDVDQCIVYYNQALIFYHLRQYSKALNIVDKLRPLIEPMDETLSKKVLFLLVELHLCMKQSEKAMGIIGLIEKVLYGNGKAAQQEKGANGKDSTESTSPNANDVHRLTITQYKVRCYMMSKSLKSCKRELKGLLCALGQQQSIPVTYLKANFEYLRNNFRKAMKILNSVQQQAKMMGSSGESLPVMYYNNLGVIHLHLRKHNLGAFYLRKAIHENGLAAKEYNTVDPTKTLSGRPIHTIAVSRHYELLYNMGVQLLHCGRPTAAFDCLIQSLEQCQINPRLWLRLAECCIMVYKENNLEDRKLSKRLEVIQGSEGSGIHRKLILGPGLKHDVPSSESPVIPAPTLEFGSLCLRNALMLLPEDPATRKSPKRNSDGEPSETKQNYDNILVPAPPGNPMRAVEVGNLRCSILAASAYVSLCLNDHLVALQHAEQLLRQPRLSGAHSYLGHLYLAEALVELDRIADAVSHLDPEQVTDISTTFPEHRAESDKDKNGDKDSTEQDEVKGALYPWSPRDVPQARAIMQHNLAAAHAIRGEYEKALNNLGQSTQSIGLPLPAQTYFLKLYLELMEGRRDEVQRIIKEHFGHVTPNKM